MKNIKTITKRNPSGDELIVNHIQKEGVVVIEVESSIYNEDRMYSFVTIDTELETVKDDLIKKGVCLN